MIINTLHFGEVEIDEAAVINFEEGMPGFEDAKKFAVLNFSEDNNSMKILQSVDQPHVSLAVVNPFDVKSDYDITLDAATKEALELKSEEEVAVCAVVTLPEKMTRMTANLMAPIVINTSNNKAKQIVLHESSYSTKHFILDEILKDAFKTSEDK